MSEAELFVLRARLQGGIRNCARRGALKLVLPIGLTYTESDTVVLDPNVQVQAMMNDNINSRYRVLEVPIKKEKPRSV